MYNGDEKLIHNGKYLPYTMLDFWKWAYSSLLHNMQRGTLAEFIVKSALDQGGVITPNEKSGLAPYDLDGPWVAVWERPARIEVKCSAFIQLWDARDSKDPIHHASFSIAPSKLPDKQGDYNDAAPRQRNADLYVFCLYTAKNRNTNILDLTWWEFYICSTDELDEKFGDRKSLSLSKLRSFKQPCSFEQLYGQIVQICDSFTNDSKNRPALFTPISNIHSET